MGAVIIPLMWLYLFLLVWATRRGWRWAQDRGWEGRKRWLGAAYGFLIVYLPVFWDWIPTVVAHHYYCSTESGFWVYKTPEQWKQENPGVMETLVEDKHSPFMRNGDDENHTDTQIINQRFRWITEKRRMVFLLPAYEWKREILDANNGEVIARHIDFSSGKGRDSLKFWVNTESCSDGIKNRNALYHFVEVIVNANKGGAK